MSMNLRDPYASEDLILSVPQEAMALIQSTGSYSLAGLKTSLYGITHATLELQNHRGNITKDEGFNLRLKKLTNCALSLCTRTYNITVANGAPSVDVVSEDFGTTEYRDDDFTTPAKSSCWQPNHQTHTNRSTPATDFGFCDVRSMFIWDEALTGRADEEWYFRNGTSSWTYGRSETSSQSIRHIFEVGLEHAMRNISDALTKLAREKSNRTVLGTTFVSETYASCAWPWVALPITVLLLTFMFFQLTAWMHNDHGDHTQYFVWKTSSLALLYHGLEEPGGGDTSDQESLNGDSDCTSYANLVEMKQAANSRTIQLRSDFTGRLVLK